MRACARDQNPVVPQGTSIISSGIFAGWNAREITAARMGRSKVTGLVDRMDMGHIERNANTSQGCFAENDESLTASSRQRSASSISMGTPLPSR